MAAQLHAWEGHDWKRWQEVTTWRKPNLQAQQTGQRELVPLLGGLRSGPAASVQPGTVSLAAWEQRRSQFAATILAVLGKAKDLQVLPVEARAVGEEEFPDHTRRKVIVRTERDDYIPAYLLIPKPTPTGRLPAMICLHQTVAQGKAEPCGIQGDPELAFALELVRRGYICLAPDVIGFGERIPAGKQPYHDSLAFYRRHPEWSFMGKMIWDLGRVVDYLESLPFVDARRIGSIGHSHGAYGTLFAAAFEPRLSVAIASCGFTTFRRDPAPDRWSHATALLPQLGAYLPDAASIPFDWHQLLALIAPRRLFVWYATKDTIFPNTENLDALLKDVRTVYDLHGAGGALAWEAFDGAHRFPAAGRETAYRWLDAGWSRVVGGVPATTQAAAAPTAPALGESPAGATNPPPVKTRSAFFPRELVARARANARQHRWAAEARDALVAACRPWLQRSDDELWDLMFSSALRRSWHVWSNGFCPACRKPVPMYEWMPDALGQPWKMRCPQCKELFPKNDFLKFYRSGLDERGQFEPARAARALLFNVEHPDPADPLHRFGVDDGEGYLEGTNRWRFIGAYLIFGQWKQAIVGGIRNLAAAYVVTGDPSYAHKAGLLLDRVADLYPEFDFGQQGVLYEGPARSGYISTWHDACVEVHDLALAYDAVFEGLAQDAELARFLAAKAARHRLPQPKSAFADIQRNIEQRIFVDTLRHRPRIESNYPSTDVTITTLETVLGWPGNRAEVMALLDAIIQRASAVDGVSGEKGTAGYTTIAPRTVAELLGRYARADPGFLREAVRRHPALHAMFRFHLDTWCLGQYYPRSGDTGSFAERNPSYVGLGFSKSPGMNPSSSSFLWELFEATGDKDFVRLLYAANDSSAAGLPYDLFAADPAGFQTNVSRLIAEAGAAIKLASVNKTQWGLAILRSGEGARARAAWLDYDSGERHGHADAMNLGLFALGLDLLPDFGYPPVQYGGWSAPRAVWYLQTAAHNTVAVDGQNTRPGTGATTLWFDGGQFRVVRASAPKLAACQQYERTVAVADVSARDAYVIDVFRVTGGAEHTRFLHGHFGRVTTQGLELAPVAETRFGEVMRNFQRDPHPVPGWSVDWAVEDLLKYLPASNRVHLRLTDFTRDAAVELAEGWVSVSGFGGVGEAWIPRVLVRRQAARPPLSSTFVGVIEPHEQQPNLATIRRLELQDAHLAPRNDQDVALEINLADGRRDVFLSVSVEAGSGAAAPQPMTLAVVEPANGVRFEGELCLVRLAAARRPSRVVLCRAKSLRVGELVIRLKNQEASVELDLQNPNAPIVAGSPAAVEAIELAGARLWPKATP